MSIAVETLEKLERKIVLSLPVNAIADEVKKRLDHLARRAKVDGFRPGKVPVSVVAKMYGPSVEYEVMNDKVSEVFFQSTQEAKIRVAGAPRISQREGVEQEQLTFDAIFEVYPEIDWSDLSQVEIETVQSTIDDTSVDKTIEILRQQRRSFAQRAKDAQAQEGDRVTIDFEGTLDGEPFQGGQSKGFQFILGDGQMLQEFEKAVSGMKVGESKTFPLPFPDDYHGKEVAGKTADFLVTVHQIEAQHLPELDEAMIKSMGVSDGTQESLKADIRKNLERELKNRLLSRNKSAVLDAVVAKINFDVPASIVQAEIGRMLENAQADLKKRGLKNIDPAALPADLFKPQAERRIRLGLAVSELIEAFKLEAPETEIEAYLNDLAASYERPEEMVRWYKADQKRMAEVAAIVLENKVVDFILSKAKVTSKTISFDELMGK